MLTYLTITSGAIDGYPDTVQIDTCCRTVEIIVFSVPVDHQGSAAQNAFGKGFKGCIGWRKDRKRAFAF